MAPSSTNPRESQQLLQTTKSDPNRPVPSLNPAQDNFFARLKTKAKDPKAHKAAVENYLANFEADKKNLADTERATEERRLHSKTYTNHFYDLVTDFYEYGWGRSFHFARMFKDTSFQQNLARHEAFLAMKMNLKETDLVLDVGCGVGGPMREIAKLSGAHITGLNNNEYQVERCKILAESAGLSSNIKLVHGDFCAMSFQEGTFNAVYSIEATCHAPRLEQVYAEIFRVLKPGGVYANYEWCTTEKYEEANLEIKRIVHLVEEGNSIAKFYTIPQAIEAAKSVGFELLEYSDLADPTNNLSEAMDPWYQPLVGSWSKFEFSQVTRTPLARSVTDNLVWGLEKVGVAPAGTSKVSKLLNSAADNLVVAGKEGVFTPMFFFLARKPFDAAPASSA